MSETRVNMRKIVGLNDDLFNLAPQGHRPRIGMGLGVAYASGYHAGNDGGLGSLDGKGELGERDADIDGKDDGPKPRDGGEDALHNASQMLPPTGEIPGLSDLYDCSSGRCVNVRFDGIIPPPDGWPNACRPQRDRSKYNHVVRIAMVVDGYLSGTYATTTEIDDIYVWDKDDYPAALAAMDAKIKRAAQAWYPGWPKRFRWKGTSDALKKRMLAWFSSPANNGQMYIYYDQEKSYAGSGYWYSVATIGYTIYVHSKNSSHFKNAPINIDWPSTRCSEVAYDVEGGQFKDGTCGNDPLLPQHLKGQYSGFELCDKDGNKVRVKRTLYGIEVEQEAYSRVTTINPDNFKVIYQSIK
ncbi:hypothetical protein [Neisseria shayeganii]|uniref:Uncharacterized protein n=1 Tax=Neisseria shayeganii 871 TaxID=1032488 RepID=G4CGA5_9NEIS|nr:hypothetical protein [Neisseria shayeganii]EGY53153.1 hypothetical protein HMPREF9371_0644 [Neisseria shayeganii 871]